MCLSSPVTDIEPGDRARPAEVRFAGGQRVWADEVVLAVRAPAQAALLAPCFRNEAEQLAAVDYVPIAVVAVGFRRADGPAVPAGFGFLRGHDADARILGATFNSQLNPAVAPPGCELITAFVGGSEDRAAVALEDDVLKALVLRDLAGALGGTILPEFVHVRRWPRAIPLFVPGHRARMAAANAALGAARLRLLGAHVTGVSLNDCCAPLAPLGGPLPHGLRRA